VSHTVKVFVSNKSKIGIQYDGFVGNSCFVEAERIKAALKALGINMEVTKVSDVKEEVEVRKLETGQRVGAR
jgi:hypothetical protein